MEWTVALAALAGLGGGIARIVWLASGLLPLAALGAAVALGRGRSRLAGALLLVSAATPTYFAWVLNLPALVVGVVLLFRAPARSFPPSPVTR